MTMVLMRRFMDHISSLLLKLYWSDYLLHPGNPDFLTVQYIQMAREVPVVLQILLVQVDQFVQVVQENLYYQQNQDHL